MTIYLPSQWQRGLREVAGSSPVGSRFALVVLFGFRKLDRLSLAIRFADAKERRFPCAAESDKQN